MLPNSRVRLRQRMNKMKPIWMRSPRDVKDEEYAEFYKSTFKAWDELAAHTHFSLEGQVEFRALLFVPSVLPYELSRNMFDETSRNMRLYVKRVFINDKFEELLPRWLMFLRGVVSRGIILLLYTVTCVNDGLLDPRIVSWLLIAVSLVGAVLE